MEHSIPTVTPDRGSTLAVDDTLPDDTLPDDTPSQTAPAGPAASSTTPPPPDPQPEMRAAAQPPSGLRFTATTADMVEIGAMLFREAEAIMKSGQKKRLKIRLGRRTLAEMPLKTGAVGVIVAAMAAVALSRLTVEIE